MGSAGNTKSDAPTIPQCSTTEVVPQVDPRDASFAAVVSRRIRAWNQADEGDVLELRCRGDQIVEEDNPDIRSARKCNDANHKLTIKLLAKGGYNDTWLVTTNASLTNGSHCFVLRMPNSDSLKPHQVRNEVGWLKYMAKNYHYIPVPQLYAYSDGALENEEAFVAEEFIEGAPLSETWKSYSEPEKDEVARKIAEIVVKLGEVRFDAICGIQPDGTLGPTVEGVKLFKGRKAFHHDSCYDIGPYSSIERYVLAYYHKEIY